MAGGRRPKPTVVKMREGNPGKRPMSKTEPKPTGKLPKLAPKNWGKVAKKEYVRIKKAIDQLGAASSADIESLRLYCEAAADHTAACEALDLADETSGRFYPVETKSGGLMWRPHPAIAAKANAEVRMKGWLVEHGLTPSARTKVSSAKDDEPKSKAAKYLNKKRA